MDTLDPFTAHIPTPTAARPLLGLTILVVEDSRFACEAMRLLCLRSGARIRRADSMRSARRHLQVYRPSVAIVDLGLPDGDGIDLIRDIHEAQARVGVIIGTSGQDNLRDAALAAGADGFLDKPVYALSAFQEVILAALPSDRQPSGPRSLSSEEVVPDRIAYQDDMAHIAEVLDDLTDDHALGYVAQFLSGVARSAKDDGLEHAAIALAKKCALGESASSEVAKVAGLVQNRLNNEIAI